jgi:hypothetical protein
VYHHHINGNNHNSNNVGPLFCNNHQQNGVSKSSVILNYDKNTLEYKNNKNLILNQQKNKVDASTNNNHHHNSSTTTATTQHYNNHQQHFRNHHHNSSTNNHNHQIYEKNLNGINQLKNELLNTKSKRYITTTTTGVENCVDSHHQKSNKFHIAKNHHNGIDETDNHLLHTNGLLSKSGLQHRNLLHNHHHHRQTNHQLQHNIDDVDNSGSNVLENIPTNVNIHKVNGHLNGLLNSTVQSPSPQTTTTIRNGQHRATSVRVSEITNGYQQQQQHELNGHSRTSHETATASNGNGFVRSCAANGRTNDFSTIKINYVSRHQIVRGPSTMTVSNGFHSNGNSSSSSNLHEPNPTKIISTTNIPNIVINEINGPNDHDSPSPSSSSSTSSYASSSMDEKEEVLNGKKFFFPP